MADKRRRRQRRTGFPFACKSNLRLFTSGRSRLKVVTFALLFSRVFITKKDAVNRFEFSWKLLYLWATMSTFRNERGKLKTLDVNAASWGERLWFKQFTTWNRRIKRARSQLKSTSKRTVLTDLCRWKIHTVWLRILSTGGCKGGKFYRYARTFSVLKYNFRSIHFFVNQIAMFVSEIWESRCRYAGSASAISGHFLRKLNWHRFVTTRWRRW